MHYFTLSRLYVEGPVFLVNAPARRCQETRCPQHIQNMTTDDCGSVHLRRCAVGRQCMYSKFGDKLESKTESAISEAWKVGLKVRFAVLREMIVGMARTGAGAWAVWVTHVPQNVSQMPPIEPFTYAILSFTAIQAAIEGFIVSEPRWFENAGMGRRHVQTSSQPQTGENSQDSNRKNDLSKICFMRFRNPSHPPSGWCPFAPLCVSSVARWPWSSLQAKVFGIGRFVAW